MKPALRWLPAPVGLAVLVVIRYAALSKPQWTMASDAQVHDVGGRMTLKSIKLQSSYDTMGCMVVEFPDYFNLGHASTGISVYISHIQYNSLCSRELHMYSSTTSRCLAGKPAPSSRFISFFTPFESRVIMSGQVRSCKGARFPV